MCRQTIARGVMTLAAATLWTGLLAPATFADELRAPESQSERRGAGGKGESQGKAVPRAEAPKPAPPPAQRPRAVPRDDQRRSGPAAAPRGPVRPAPPVRTVPGRYHAVPRTYYFPTIDVRLRYYYHPYFGFYYGPYYGPFYPYPGPWVRHTRYSVSALRLRVKPDDAEVYLNGYFAGIVDDFNGAFQRLYVPAGQHHLEIRLEGYESLRQDVYVGPGDTLEIVQTMVRLRPGERMSAPPRPRALPPEWTEPEAGLPGEGEEGLQPASPYGILAIRPEPADAQIFVDGEAWDAVEGQGELVIHLPSGWHTLEVRKAGYQPFSTRLELTEGQTTRLNVALKP
ncbi:MAG: PEGA domain-containing protein [Vicinamibacterales bacterium]